MTTDGDVGDRAAARDLLRRRRRGAHAVPIGQLIQDWYFGTFIAASLLTMLFAVTGSAILTPDCSTAVCLEPAGYRAVAAALAVVGAVGLFLGIRATGPASSDPGRATWLLASPADRGVLLRGTVLHAAAAALVAGGVGGLLVGFALARGTGAGVGVVIPVVAGGGGGVLCALLLLPVAMRWQGGSARLLTAVRAVPDVELARAGRVVGAVSSSTLMLETTPLDVLAVRRRLARRGRYRSRTGAGGPLLGILVHELTGMARRRARVVLGLIACAGALVAGLLLGRFLGALLAALAVFAATRAVAGGLAMWLSTSGLRRSVPAAPAAVTAVLGLAPFVLALVGAVIALAALGLPWWGPLLLATGCTAGVLRSYDPPPGLGVAISTPAGAVHTGLVKRLVLGPDLALLSALVLLLGETHDLGVGTVLVGVGLLAWQVLRDRD